MATFANAEKAADADGLDCLAIVDDQVAHFADVLVLSDCRRACPSPSMRVHRREELSTRCNPLLAPASPELAEGDAGEIVLPFCCV